MFRAASVVLAVALSALAAVPAVAGADRDEPQSRYARALLRGDDPPAHWWRLDGDWFSVDAIASDRPGTLLYGGQVDILQPGALASDPSASIGFSGAVPDARWESHLVSDLCRTVDARGRSPFSLESWIRPRTLDASTRRILSFEDPTRSRLPDAPVTQGGYLLGARADGLVFARYVRTDEGEQWSTVAVPAPALDRWTHVVASYDGMRMRLYVNGEPVAERDSTIELPGCNARETPVGVDRWPFLTIGAQSVGTTFYRPGGMTPPTHWLEWDGWLDEPAWYDRALGADDVRRHWRAGSGAGASEPDE